MQGGRKRSCPGSWECHVGCVSVKLQAQSLIVKQSFFVDKTIELCVMPSSHCTILARYFTRRQVLINRRQMPQIGGKLVLVHASDNRDLRESPRHRRRPWNIWHTKYLELSAIHNHAVCNDFWLKTTSAMTFSQWETKIQGRGKF